MNIKWLTIIFLILLTACSKEQTNEDMTKSIRQAAYAGQFYPSEPGAITDKIHRYLEQADAKKIDGQVKAVMVPHAGYDYSGPVASYAFKQLEGKKINTAVIISNSHKEYFDGAAIDSNDAWQTPLGEVAVDKELADKLVKADKSLKYDGSIHKADHPIEVEVPFLQTVLNGEFKIVPIMFGNKNDEAYNDLAKALYDNLGEDDIVVVSTDMSHYPKYEDANKIDKETLEKIKSGRVEDLENYIKTVENSDYDNEQTALCGIDAVKTLLELSRLAGWSDIEVLKYANSGDTPLIGDKTSVVGYGAMAFAQAKKVNNEDDAKDLLSGEQQKILLDIAKKTIESYVSGGEIPEFNISDEKLKKAQGAFVTLNKNGQLRGCIGQIVPDGTPLWQVVRDMAIEAATADSRFSPVDKKELADLEYEVSVLSVPEKIDDWKKIKLGEDGVIIRSGRSGGVFLPQVATETGWSLEEFLSQLCWQKAGLAPDCYKDKNVEIQVFKAQVIK